MTSGALAVAHRANFKRLLPAITLLALARCAPSDLLNATIPRAGLTIGHDIAYGPDPRQKLDIYRPRDAVDLPVVVFFYGGSWNSGSKSIYPFVAATLARTGAIVVVPDYRVYPQVTYPDFLRDCAAAVAWAQSHGASLGGGGSLFLMGHSAGAYNAVMLGLDSAWIAAAGGDPKDISGVIGLAGPYDFLPITDPKIIPIFPNAGPDSQPVTYAGASKPPLLLITGQDDTEVRPRNTAALAARTQAAGGAVDTRYYPGIGHIGLVTAIAPLLQWRAPVLRDITAFIREHASSHLRGSVRKPAVPAL